MEDGREYDRSTQYSVANMPRTDGVFERAGRLYRNPTLEMTAPINC
jgi:hypothetical protein